MASLTDILCDAARRKSVVADCVALLDGEVDRRGGVSGLAIKAGFKVVKAVRPGIIPDVVDHLLDDFAKQIDPLYQQFQTQGGGGSFAGFIGPRASQAANLLLQITDQRAAHNTNRTLVAAYNKLRPVAEKNVAESIPAVGRLIDKYLKT